MKKIYNTAQKRSVRRWFKQMLDTFIKHINCNCQSEIKKLSEAHQELVELVDVIAREVARQAKRGK